MRTSWILCFSALFGISAMANAATIYKWTDSQGRIHFGSQPPVGYSAETITTKNIQLPAATRDSSETAATEAKTQKEIDRQVQRQIATEEAELRQFCARTRTTLAQLNNNPRLLAEVDGKTVRLSEEERQRRINEAREQIRQNCQGL